MADTDTIKFLEEVKKGKPRRFVMICKGIKILSLIVYKKGTVESFKKKAKEHGQGQFYHGVVDGKGQNIVFNLCKEDGYDQPPGKALILKDYLKSHLSMQLKPDYRIVEALPDVVEEDEADEIEEEAIADVPDTSEIQARFSSLAAGIKQFVATQPDRRVEILKPAKVVKEYLADPSSNAQPDANDALAKVEELVASASPQSKSNTDGRAEQWKKGLKDIAPQVKSAVQSGSSSAVEIKQELTLARARADKGDYESALSGLAKIKQLLKVTPQSDVLAIWRDAKDSVDSELNSFVNELRKTGDEYLMKIAEGGVNAFVAGPKGLYVKLQAALIGYQGAKGDAREKARGKILNAVTEYQKYVGASGFLRVADSNKLNGPLNMQSTLLGALTEIREALSS